MRFRTDVCEMHSLLWGTYEATMGLICHEADMNYEAIMNLLWSYYGWWAVRARRFLCSSPGGGTANTVFGETTKIWGYYKTIMKTLCKQYDVVWCGVMSCDVVWCGVMSCDVVWWDADETATMQLWSECVVFYSITMKLLWSYDANVLCFTAYPGGGGCGGVRGGSLTGLFQLLKV